MIPIPAFLLSGVSAGLNRKWRGEGQAPRWVWYLFMAAMGYAVTFDPYFTMIWLLFLLGYALMPWQAMFSAIHGKAPGRDDPPYAMWMQSIAKDITHLQMQPSMTIYYYRFGVIYGAIRSLPMMPAVLMFCGYTHSWIPAIGALFFFMGYVYYLCGNLAAYIQVDRGKGVMFSEIVMGWSIATYMLICAACL